MGFLGFLIIFALALSGYQRDWDIPEWGQFIDVLAGIEVGFVKLCFIYWKRHELTAIIQMMNGYSMELRTRGNQEREIKRLRDYFYMQEMVVFLFTSFFGVFVLIVLHLQAVFISDPKGLVVPVDAILTGSRKGYWTVYACQCVLCPFVGLVMTSCDAMIGNIYNQLILHLEVLHHDITALDEANDVTSELMEEKFCEFIRTYQSLRQLNKRFDHCMEPYFINNVLATVFATTFTCVEMGIMVNVDLMKCVKPFMYFLFTIFPFFYWCWLGNRVNEKVNQNVMQ